MATAYLAAAQGPGGFNKLVVIKKLRTTLAAEQEFLKMFLDEARLAARINHPNVVQTHEVGVEPPECYIAMEYLEGQSYETVLRRAARKAGKSVPDSGEPVSSVGTSTGAVPLKFQLNVICHALAGLDHAHELKDFDGTPLNVVHRDVSPHNLIVTYDGHVKLLDFGIAKAADSSGDTRTGVMKGKCAYMPAEQFGGKDIDRRADVFAVGVVLWQALAGRRLWQGLSDAEIFQKVAMGAVPTPSSVRDGVDPKLEAIAMKALAHRREDRYATAADMQTALEEYIASTPGMRSSAKELGAFVADLFAEDRVKLKGIIESALKTPRVDHILNLAEGAPASSTQMPISGRGTPVQTISETGQSGTLVSTPAEASSPRSRLLVFAGIGAVAVIAIVVALVAKPGSGTSGGAATGDTAKPQVAEESSLRLRATPSSARLYLDGKRLEGNPAAAVVPRDGKTHIVRAEADGYVTAEETIVADVTSASRDLALSPAPSAPSTASSQPGPTRPGIVWGMPPKATASASAATSAAAPPQVTAAPNPTTGPAPTGRPLDTGDPWADKNKKPGT
jgi:serine/threonine-protein kinase